jgi:hypothetical protein
MLHTHREGVTYREGVTFRQRLDRRGGSTERFIVMLYTIIQNVGKGALRIDLIILTSTYSSGNTTILIDKVEYT